MGSSFQELHCLISVKMINSGLQTMIGSFAFRSIFAPCSLVSISLHTKSTSQALLPNNQPKSDSHLNNQSPGRFTLPRQMRPTQAITWESRAIRYKYLTSAMSTKRDALINRAGSLSKSAESVFISQNFLHR